jgi:broad specificity phosphatase PhoE
MDPRFTSLLEQLQSVTLTLTEFLVLSGAALLLILILIHRLQPKRFYIIRHGQTLLNVAGIKQGAEGKLSPAGVAQAQRVGQAFKEVRVGHIYTSPYERAVETATLIQQAIKRPLSIAPLLAERRNATEVLGKSTADPEVIRIMGLTAYGYHEDSYRFSDEENFEDLRARAKACLAYLERRRGKRLLLVTHHAFLQMLLSYMLYRDKLTSSAYTKLSYFNPADNAGVTICDYHPWHGRFKATRGWDVVAYNQVVS